MAVHVKIKVGEAYRDDVGKPWARLNRKTREELGVELGDVISIKGGRSNQSAVLVWSARKEDEGRDIIRIDGLVRISVETKIGSKVRIAKCKPRNAEMVFLSPLIGDGTKLSPKPGIEKRIRRTLAQRPVTRGDSLLVPGLTAGGNRLVFAVREVDPKGVVRITGRTMIDFDPQGLSDKTAQAVKRPAGQFSFQIYERENGYFWQILEGGRPVSKSVKQFDTYMECVREILRLRGKIKGHLAK